MGLRQGLGFSSKSLVTMLLDYTNNGVQTMVYKRWCTNHIGNLNTSGNQLSLQIMSLHEGQLLFQLTTSTFIYPAIFVLDVDLPGLYWRYELRERYELRYIIPNKWQKYRFCSLSKKI